MSHARTDNPQFVSHRLSEDARRLLERLHAELCRRGGHVTRSQVLERAIRQMAEAYKLK